MNALKERYKKEIVPALMKEFGFKNIMQVPHLSKDYRQYWYGRSLG